MSDTLDAFHDADRVLRQAAATFFDHLSEMCEGILVVDRAARIVWANDRWQRYLNALGFARQEDVIGRPVQEVVPNTLMHRVVETGKPILLDILENKAGTYIVSRFPLHDDRGELIGAVGLILYDQLESLKPLIGRLNGLQRELAQAKKELAQQRRTKYTFTNFVGNSPAALAVKSRARRAAALNTTVLLLGETGTGKELIAQAIHAASPRAAGPFIAINVAAIPEALLEAEFFGVAPGAYTGADKRGREGKFRLADGGTLFLDEIGDMPLPLQAKLLRALQEREFEPLGSNEVVRIDVRVIAGSSLDLGQRVAEGRFRADLFYRLNVLPIRLPPLRERLEDLETLCEHLLEQIAAEQGTLPKEIDGSAVQALRTLAWPGNIRELRNVLEQAASFWDGLRLTVEAFVPIVPEFGAHRAAADAGDVNAPDAGPPMPLREASSADPARLDAEEPMPFHVLGYRDAGPAADAPPASVEPPATLPQRIARLEIESIREALHATGGNRVRAARRLGISRATLYQKLAERPELSGI
jgi:transcriptional regulator with PAS, ATPase and Fis domain